MVLYLIRHGQTDYNKQYRMQGQSDIPLNDYGRELAYQAIEKIKDVDFDLCFSSPLSRARETAQIILDGRKVPIIEDDRIREIGFGEFEGLCHEGENCNIPDPDFFNFFNAPERYIAPPGGESFEAILERTGSFWNELQSNAEYRNKTILIATHGCALKAILANIRHTPFAEFWGAGCYGNCAMTRVEVSESGITVTENI